MRLEEHIQDKPVVAGCAFVIELAFLNGRERLAGYDVNPLVVYDSE